MTESKVCPQCQQEYFKPKYVSRNGFAKRIYCSHACAAASKLDPSSHFLGGRRIVPNCDCGQPATGMIWVYQLYADGEPCRQFIEVCADCREMFLQDDPGAMVEMPARPKWADWAPKLHVTQYSRPAHLPATKGWQLI
jgi:hypothetical protein